MGLFGLTESLAIVGQSRQDSLNSGKGQEETWDQRKEKARSDKRAYCHALLLGILQGIPKMAGKERTAWTE